MSRPVHRRRRASAFVLVAAALAAAAFVSAAIAASFTLNVTKHATVTNFNTHKSTHANVVVNSKGRVVYALTGDSMKHPECVKSNQCLMFWPPVTVSSLKHLSRASGVKGKLGTWKRNGFIQVTLDGHPLYTFSQDSKRGVATGEALASFGGVWHVRKPAATSKPATPAPPVTGAPGGY
jgi:predicted lipoprotein with Yx(FWY)xxD motif